MAEKLKTIKDVFPDFKTDTELLSEQIKDVNLYKKKECRDNFLSA